MATVQQTFESETRIITLAERARLDLSISIGSIAALIGEVAENGIVPLTNGQLKELNNASLGLTPEQSGAERTVDGQGVDANEAIHDREIILGSLGAATMPEAVRKAIEIGTISIDLEDESNSIPNLKPKPHAILTLISEGKTAQQIQDIRNIHRNTVTNNLHTIQEVLEAEDPCHAVRRAFETRLFPLPLTQEKLDRARMMHVGVGLILSALGVEGDRTLEQALQEA